MTLQLYVAGWIFEQDFGVTFHFLRWWCGISGFALVLLNGLFREKGNIFFYENFRSVPRARPFQYLKGDKKYYDGWSKHLLFSSPFPSKEERKGSLVKPFGKAVIPAAQGVPASFPSIFSLLSCGVWCSQSQLCFPRWGELGELAVLFTECF